MKALQKIINNRRHLCFLDLEGTQFSHEMIAIGAILVDLKRDNSIKKIHKGYYTLVRSKNSVGKVVEEMTKISDAMLKKDGVSFRKAMNGLNEYLGKAFGKVLFVTFGSHDIRIIEQSMQYNLDADVALCKHIIHNHFDFAEFINQYIRSENNNTYSLTNLLKLFNIEFSGTVHDALDDTKNLISLYDAVLKNDELIAKEYKKTLAKMRHLPMPIAKVIEDLSKDKTVDSKTYEKYIMESIK